MSRLCCTFGLVVALASASRGGQMLKDDFERDGLAGGPVAWQAKGTWGIEKGQLVNRYKGGEKWPNEALILRAPRPMPVGGTVRVDASHDALHRTPGYIALLARDAETKAYVEWVSSRNSTALESRTSGTDPEMKPLPAPRNWLAGQLATYAIRWLGYDEKTNVGRVDLLYAAKAAPDAELAVAATLEVANLRKLDQFELVINADDQAAMGPTVAFDNFALDVAEGPDAPLDFTAKPGPGARIRLAWKDVPDEAGYLLQRAVGPAGEWQDAARLPADAASFDDTQGTPSVLFRYRLRAENAKGQSCWTPVAEASLPGPPLAPTGLQAAVGPSGRARIEWQENGVGVAQVAVERQQRDGAPWQTFAAVPGGRASAVDWVPAQGTVRYRARAVNQHGPSPWSEAASAERPKPPPTLVSPVTRVVSRQADLPVAAIDIVFDQPVKSSAEPTADFAVTAVKHPWHNIALPSPRITSVAFDPEGKRARVAFEPAIPELVEYRIEVKPSLTGLDGAPVAAPPVRVGVLLGDEDADGFVAPAAGVRLGYRLAMPPMPIGIMAEDIEWNTENGAHNVEHIIELMDAYKGIDFFRVNLWWDMLEPEQGEFDPKYVSFLKRVLDAAEQRQLPLEIGIRQVRWPLWVCNHKGFHNALYDPRVAPKLADTWRRVALLCHECPVVFAYWPISEEYPGGGDVKNYLPFLSRVATALRTAHPGCVVKARPAGAPFEGGNEVTPIVSQRGAQDICMAAGIYPTGWQWDIPNPTPLSAASFNNMQAFRFYASEVQGGPNGIGEIGFRAALGSAFGDAERLLAFERVMSLAHDVGLLEFVIWGEAWTFSDPATFFPHLRAFRDLLIRRPRRAGFDLCLVDDTKGNFAHPPYAKEIGTDLSPVFRWLEERGYRFYLTTPAAMKLQKGAAKASLEVTQLAKLGQAQQSTLLQRTLAGVAPTGVVLPWLGRAACHQSLAGLPCHVEIEFPGAQGTCDAVSLSPTRLQVYAPPGTLVRWRRPGEGGDWHDVVTAGESRITILDIPEAPR